MTSDRVNLIRFVARRCLIVLGVALSLAIPNVTGAQTQQQIRLISDNAGWRLQVDGKDFMVLGMNWDYFPVGTTYTYNFWGQPDDMIRTALDREMSLLRSMGVNTLRIYAGIPPRWVEYIYRNHGIYTVLNHSMGRYGVTLDGAFVAQTDYSDPRARALIRGEVEALVREFRNVPGVLMWLLGNENNYGLEWRSAETEALPVGERQAFMARHLYSLFGEVTQAIKAIDPTRPVAMANGDLQYIDIIAEEVRGLDVFGTNVYRGITFTDLYEVVQEKLGIPVMLTEFGADAWNARYMREDQLMQTRYLLGQWQEIYEQSHGKGRAGNSIGGLTFQWSDGWWKHGQEDRLDIQDTHASWPNDAYMEDYVPGDNNMNEEWWGIMAKGFPDHRGHFELYPRGAFYALKDAFRLDPYAPGTTLATIRQHFGSIDPVLAVLRARGDRAALAADPLERLRLTGLRLDLETYSTGGTRLSTPSDRDASTGTYPAFLGFDRKESFFAEIQARPVHNITGTLALNLLGNVPENPIDEIFYENRGRSRTVRTIDGEELRLNGLERLAVYSAAVDWDDRWFNLKGFYRTGHYHWGYEGDFFGLYREANYGPFIDIYNAEAPIGVEIAGKRGLSGARLAFGPELWWGANPAVLAKYRRPVGRFLATGIFQEDIARQRTTASSFAIPLPPTRKFTLHLATRTGPFDVELGGIWSGSTKEGETFQIADGAPGSFRILQDEVKASDAFGGRAKLTLQRGRWNWYLQGALMGLVADGGPTSTLTFTGWHLKDSGSGNQQNVLTGLAVNLGNWQIAPNFLWQKPIVGPIPREAPVPARPRNVLDDPFAVRANRETVAFELLLNYDPTPATWMFAWDSDVREDARLAASLGFIFRHHPTTMDAAIGILPDGRTTFPFPGAPPARDLWETHGRIVSRLGPGFGMIANLFAGQGEARGSDPRLIERYGGDVRFALNSFRLQTMARFNDWGPYDYHRDFNLTFPAQLTGDLSYVLGRPTWFDLAQTRFGIRGTWRSLDRYSPRYCPGLEPAAAGQLVCTPNFPGPRGDEWEVRTYLQLVR
jgi:beta-galactosidase